MFRKKHAPHIYAHHSRHTRAHHAHTYGFMYDHVYTCTHCECTSHIVKFYYYKINALNFANKFVWARKGANPHVPKRVWVPKATPIFYVGVGSRLT